MKLLRLKIFALIFPFTLLLGQTGPAGVGMGDGSSALKLWLDANNGIFRDTLQNLPAEGNQKIMLWKDLSGSNNDVRAEKDTNSPTLITASPLLNHQNAIRFFRDKDASNRRNYLASKAFTKTNDITIYCVFHAVSKAAGTNTTPYKSKGYDLNMWYGGAGLVDGGVGEFVNDVSLAFCDSSIAAGVGDSTTGTDYCVKAAASIHKTYFALMTKEAWTGRLSVGHNNILTTSYQAGAQPINNAEKYFIGSTSDVNTGKLSPFFDGYIASVLVYNRLLNTAEKIILENYLSAKYSLPLLSNDLYTFDNATLGDYDHELIGIGKAIDGSFQLTAKGEGILELSNGGELEKGEFLFVAHDGKAMSPVVDDVPDGIQTRLERKWVFSGVAKTKTIDLAIDAQGLTIDAQSLALLIDTDHDGSFADETLGEGMILPTAITNSGRIIFQDLKFKSGYHFTLAQVKPLCESNCESYFSPDGDGIADVYHLDDKGKTSIYDRSGKLVRSLTTPAYWDGTNDKGEPLAPGIYFLIANDVQETVTLIK